MTTDDALHELRTQNALLLKEARYPKLNDKTRAIMRQRIEFNRARITELIDKRLGR